MEAQPHLQIYHICFNFSYCWHNRVFAIISCKRFSASHEPFHDVFFQLALNSIFLKHKEGKTTANSTERRKLGKLDCEI